MVVGTLQELSVVISSSTLASSSELSDRRCPSIYLRSSLRDMQKCESVKENNMKAYSNPGWVRAAVCLLHESDQPESEMSCTLSFGTNAARISGKVHILRHMDG